MKLRIVRDHHFGKPVQIPTHQTVSSMVDGKFSLASQESPIDDGKFSAHTLGTFHEKEFTISKATTRAFSFPGWLQLSSKISREVRERVNEQIVNYCIWKMC